MGEPAVPLLRGRSRSPGQVVTPWEHDAKLALAVIRAGFPEEFSRVSNRSDRRVRREAYMPHVLLPRLSVGLAITARPDDRASPACRRSEPLAATEVQRHAHVPREDIALSEPTNATISAAETTPAITTARQRATTTIRLDAAPLDWSKLATAERARAALASTAVERTSFDAAESAWRAASRQALTPADRALCWERLDTGARAMLTARVAMFIALENRADTTNTTLGAAPGLTLDQAMQRAPAIIAQSARTKATLPEALRLYEHVSDVQQWVDVAALRSRQCTPFELLKLSYGRHDKRLDVAMDATFHHLSPFDPDCLADAAALYFLASGTAVPHGDMELGFNVLLENDIADSRRALLLLRPLGDPLTVSSCTVDRYVIEGCLGKLPADIMAGERAAWLKKPDAAILGTDLDAAAIELASLFDLPHAEQERLLRKRFALLAESSRFPIGTPLQSMHTILLRSPGAKTVEGPDDTAGPRVFEAFDRLEQNSRQAPRTRPDPCLLAGQHLARASGLIIVAEGAAGPQILRQAIQRRHVQFRALAPAARASIMAWAILGSPVIRRSAWSGPVLHFLEQIVADFLAMSRAPRLVGARAVIDYFESRRRAYAPLPVFDASAVLTRLLVARGASREELTATRQFRYYQLGIPETFLTRNGTLVDECLIRSTLFSDVYVTVAGAAMNCKQEVSLARDLFNANYARHPTVVAKARELFLHSDGAHSVEEIAQYLAEQQVPRTAGIFDLVALLQRLTIRAPLESIAQAVFSGEPRQIVGLLPFVVPSYDIARGLWTGDGEAARQGVWRLTLDAVFCWVGGMAESAALRSAEASAAQILESVAAEAGGAKMGPVFDPVRMPTHEAISLPALDDLTRVESASPGEPAVDQPSLDMAVDHDPYSVLSTEGIQRADYEWQKKRVEAGELVHVDLHNNVHCLLTWLPRQGRTALVIEKPDSTFAIEVDELGEPVASGQLLRRINEPNRHYTAAELLHIEASGRSDWVAPNAHDLARRMSLVEATSALAEVLSAPARRGEIDWSRLFKIRVRLPQATVWRDNRISAQRFADGEQAAFIDMLDSIYRTSYTFKALQDYAYERMAREDWVILLRPNESPRVSLHEKRIYLPLEKDPVPGTYMTPTRLQPFSRWRAIVHEMLHVFTRKQDPPHTVKRLADPADASELHRGAVVALTDRILYEANYREPVRIMYACPTLTTLAHRVEHFKRLNRFKAEAEMSGFYEDREIDKLINLHRPLRNLQVGGQPVESRDTVASVMRYWRFLDEQSSGANLMRAPFDERWDATFRFEVDTGHHGLPMLAVIDVGQTMRDSLNDIYLHVPESRLLFNRWFDRNALATGDSGWTVALHRGPPPADHVLAPFLIERTGRRITLFNQVLYYTSDDGVRPYELRRRFSAMLVDLTVGDIDWTTGGPVDSFTNRGLLVWLEDQFLRTRESLGSPAVYQEPYRTSAQLASNLLVLREQLLRAYRMSSDEDRYLRSDPARGGAAGSLACWPAKMCGPRQPEKQVAEPRVVEPAPP